MKKYFLHDGTEQKGPFDIEDLKAKGLSGNTPIWYEGLENWATAGKIEELKDLFSTSTPPPFNEPKKTPPPITPSITKTETQSQSPKRKSRTGLWIVLICVILVIVIGGLMMNNNPNAIPGVKIEINTPNPIVVTSRADGSKSGLFKERTTVWATVQNQGGEGDVLVTYHVYQNGNTYERTQPVHLLANESQDLEVTFEEVKMLGGDITYDVAATAR